MHVRDLNSEKDWKAALSELEGIPDEMPLNKETAWDTLHQRMENKKRSRKFVWYYAAAVALIAISLLTFLSGKQEDAIVQKEIHSNHAPSKGSTETASIIYTDSPKTELSKISNRSAIKKIPATKSLQPVRLAIIDSAAQTNILTIDTSNSINDTVMLAITAPPVKKKLKVVHANEIGPASTNDPDMAIRRKKILLPFFNNPGTSTPVANSDNNNGGLKIKFNSAN